MVNPELNESSKDPLLVETVPDEIEVIQVGAMNPKWTRKVGLGSLGIRALPYMKKAGDKLLRRGDIDLVYFSTTMFPVTILGARWKRKFKVPYIIDMQDPWHDDYHLTRPKSERPKKFWFSHRLNKTLEPRAMRRVDGIISVSDKYSKTLQDRYSNIRPEMCDTIPFGASSRDFELLDRVTLDNEAFDPNDGMVHVVNTGSAGGHTMRFSFTVIFTALKKGLETNPELFERIRMHFLGTTYAPNGTGANTVLPIAEKCGVGEYVHEQPDRLPYFNALKVLKDAAMLVIPGLDDPAYTASKLFPYILTRKQILAVIHEGSSVVRMLDETRGGDCVPFNSDMDLDELATRAMKCWEEILGRLPASPDTNWEAIEPHTAREMTRRQVECFERVLLASAN